MHVQKQQVDSLCPQYSAKMADLCKLHYMTTQGWSQNQVIVNSDPWVAGREVRKIVTVPQHYCKCHLFVQ